MAGPPASRVALEVVGVRHTRLDSGGVEQRAPSPAETWDEFFGEFYLRAYREAERNAEAEAQALAAAKLAGCPPGGDLLDVPCGFGRHALPLAARGTASSGSTARRRCSTRRAAQGRRGGGRSSCGPTTATCRSPDESFDTALNLFSSLGYLGDEEDTRALAEIRRVLRPGGRLLIEILHRDRIVRHFAEQDWHLLGEGRLLLEQRTFDPISGVAQTTQTLIESAGARESRTFSIRVYTATELLAMLAEAGFEETRCHGDLQGGPFSTDSRLVVVAHR